MAVASPIPEGAEDNIIDYYDIMVIGRTGMGKSTTADKLVIANPDGHDYLGEQYVDEIVNEGQVKMSDLAIWQIANVEDELERVKTRLKNLVLFRSLENPHKEVNSMYQQAKKPTFGSQVISNETTRVRVLDVPGFFGKDVGTACTQNTGERVTKSGLLIMREVLRIQTAMRMKFRRIIYFIPERGRLERSHKILLMELEQMVHYFGKSIFDCMVLVATLSPDVYQFIPENVTPFTEESERTTRENFEVSLAQVLPNDEHLPDSKPPMVFISMHDSCEAILTKIKGAPVISDELRLAFDHRTCVRCGLKAKILTYKNGRKKRVACYAGEDPSVSMPYEESHCHPLIISKYWTITKIVGGIAHFITRNRYKGKWPGFRNPDDEICIECGRTPGEQGCKRIGSHYMLEGEIFVVDHTPTEPVAIVDEQQPGNEVRIVIDQPDQRGQPDQLGQLGQPDQPDQPGQSGQLDQPGQPDQPDQHRQHEQQLEDPEDPNTATSVPVEREQNVESGRQVPMAHQPPIPQSQPQQIIVAGDQEHRQLDVSAPCVVGTPDLKG